MDNESFDRMVEDVEKRYTGRYADLVRSTLSLLLLGYGVIIGYIFLLIGLILLIVWLVINVPNGATIKIGLVVACAVVPMLFHLLRSLWIRTSDPKGIILRPEQAPLLFSELDKIAARSKKIRFSQVLVNEELNACVVNTPRLGIFGWSKHHLVIGLPLMDAMPKEEFISILAHEYAHFSHAHGKVGNWLYRSRSTWEFTCDSVLQDSSIFASPLRGFFTWFWPRLNAKCFVVSRMNEYEADAFAVAMTSPAIASQALSRIHVQAIRSDKNFWGRLSVRAAKESSAPTAIMDDLQRFLRSEEPLEPMYLKESFSALTNSADTHPCLRDRAISMWKDNSVSFEMPKSLPALQESATEALLPAELTASLRKKLSAEWADQLRLSWQERHQDIKKNLAEIAEHDGSKSSRWKSIAVRANVFGSETVAEELKDFVAEYPDHMSARYVFAEHLLETLDPRGEEIMLSMKQYNPHAAHGAIASLASYYQRTGNRDRMNLISRDLDDVQRTMEIAERERTQIDIDDHFQGHELSEEDLQSFTTAIRAEEAIKAVHIARKKCLQYPDWSHYYIVVTVKFPMLKLVTEQVKQELNNRIIAAADFDGSILLHTRDFAPNAVMKKIESIDHSLVYQREA